MQKKHNEMVHANVPTPILVSNEEKTNVSETSNTI
jgi:hypothetical protein